MTNLVITPPPQFFCRRIDIALQADQCVKWLRVQGFDVLGVDAGAVAPVITIRPSPLCDQLEGAISAYERGPRGERRYRYVYRFDCEVRWADVVGANSPRRGSCTLGVFAQEVR